MDGQLREVAPRASGVNRVVSSDRDLRFVADTSFLYIMTLSSNGTGSWVPLINHISIVGFLAGVATVAAGSVD